MRLKLQSSCIMTQSHTALPACSAALELLGVPADILSIQCIPWVSLAWERRYVEQNDIHSPQVTVGESLMFSAQLRLMDVGKRDLKAFVNEVSLLPAYKTWWDLLCKPTEQLLSWGCPSQPHRCRCRASAAIAVLKFGPLTKAGIPVPSFLKVCVATGDGPGGADATAELAGGHPGQHRAQR